MASQPRQVPDLAELLASKGPEYGFAHATAYHKIRDGAVRVIEGRELSCAVRSVRSAFKDAREHLEGFWNNAGHTVQRVRETEMGNTSTSKRGSPEASSAVSVRTQLGLDADHSRAPEDAISVDDEELVTPIDTDDVYA